MQRFVHRAASTTRRSTTLGATTIALTLLASTVSTAADFVSFSSIDDGFALNEINHVSFRINSLITAGDQQFAAYYNHARRVTLARRLLGASEWEVFDTLFTDPNSNATDTHNVISMGIDGDGVLHMAWGMHNDNLLYTQSASSVIGAGPIQLIGAGAGNSSALNAMNGFLESSITYPEFYNLPDGDLLYRYRTGSSGNGDTILKRYDVATHAWATVQAPLFDGDVPGDGIPSVNAYPNTLAFDSQGNLHMSWTSRYNSDSPAGESGYQTNHNFFYAVSPDEGGTWTKQDGTPYTLPITEATAQVAVAIPEGSSLMNQESMTVDKNDLPVIASWWAPGAQQGDHTRQYMLAYYDGADWQTSQITHRPLETKKSESFVRDLARPIVLVDDDNRTLVVMRYDERGDVVTVAHSMDRQNWEFVDLTTESVGNWEPTYDAELWRRENKLHMLYQPVGLGQSSSTVSVLEWDAKAYFSDTLALVVDRATGQISIDNSLAGAVEIDGYTIGSASGQLAPLSWNSLNSQAVGGWQVANAETNRLSELSSAGGLALSASDSVSLGAAFAGQALAFGVDAQGDLQFQYTTVDGQVRNGIVQYVGQGGGRLNNLVLRVDPATGQARLENTSDFGAEIEAYSILSLSGSLLTSWNSLDDQDVGGGHWREANVGPGRLTELLASGSELLLTDDGFDLGMLYDVAGEQDLVFEFLLTGDSTTRKGVVVYETVAPTPMADLNMDGLVDIFDVAIVSNHWGNVGTPGSVLGDANKDGVVDIFDVAFISNQWRTAVVAVPEPSSDRCAYVATAFAAMYIGVTRSRAHPMRGRRDGTHECIKRFLRFQQ